MKNTIRNKIDEAGLVTFDVASLSPPGLRRKIDLASWLENDLIIKEKSFNKSLGDFDWSSFNDCFVSVFCSKDVIIPPWAYLLVQAKLRNIAKYVFLGEHDNMELLLIQRSLTKMNINEYKDKRVFIKYCGNKKLPVGAVSLCLSALMPVVKSLFYGEPCSSIVLMKN